MFAIAGGAGPGDEDVLSCCGMFPVMPLVALLAVLAVYRDSLWAALGALLLAGLPYLLLRQMVAGYHPSDDSDVMADQAVGREAVRLYNWLVAVGGVSVAGVAVRRLVRWGRRRAGYPVLPRSEPVGRVANADRYWVPSFGMVAVVLAGLLLVALCGAGALWVALLPPLGPGD